MVTTGNRDSFVTWGDHDTAHPAVQIGQFSISALELSKVVLFDRPMPSDQYLVFLQPDSSVSAQFYPSSFTVDGFTVNLSASVTATFSYLAIEQTTTFGVTYTP